MTMKLDSLGYLFDPIAKIWMRSDYPGIQYNDGDEIENRIAAVIKEASDLSVLSTELRQHCTDWPSLYHLTGTRANIMRPFEAIYKNAQVLEIGAGCGAITRYLGESGANVLALEGSPRRAAIARSRTRELDNVTVLAEKFDQFKSTEKFDVVTLIGVLEYANLFTPGENPTLNMLERVRQLLKPEGKLIIAIENQLGLKYFAGAPEDHLGQPMVGIEGRYRQDQPQTFGRKVLASLLKQAGFATSEFLAPFPDYKLPVSIVTETGFANKNFDAGAFAWQSALRDRQLPSYCNFSLELAWPELVKNELGLDVSNSFLIMASPTSQPLSDSKVMAWHYSTERKARYCKETVFTSETGKSVDIQYRRFVKIDHAPSVDKQENALIQFVCPDTDHYTLGKPLSLEFIHIVTHDGWTLEQVGRFIQRYLLIIKEDAKAKGLQIDLSVLNPEVPGTYFDFIPQNIIIDSHGKQNFIDQEWLLSNPVELSHLVFRSLISLCNSVTRFGQQAGGGSMTSLEFIQGAFAAAGIQFRKSDCDRYSAIEIAVQEAVSGGARRETFDAWMGKPLITPNASQVMYEHGLFKQKVLENQSQIENYEKSIIGRDTDIRKLTNDLKHSHVSSQASDFHLANIEQLVSQRNEQITFLSQRIADMHHSASWRLTAPMRFVTRQLKRAPIAVRLVLPAIKLGGGVGGTVKKAINLYRREGIPGIKRGFRAAALGQQGTPSSVQMAPPAHDVREQTSVHHDSSGSKVADGVWEWAAYCEVKNRIQQFKQTQVEQLALNPVPLVHVESDALDATASAINFPELIANPMVSIILPVFNHAQLTLECLASIAGSDSTVSYEIIIADDASTDDTSRILQLVKNVKYFRNESNLGFLKNTNKALEHVAGTYVLYLNNDVQVSGAWLSTLLATFKDFPSAGAVGPAFIYPSGHLQEAGAAFNLDGTADMIGLNESPQQARFSYTRRVDYVSGACLLIPAKLVQSLGGFSEEFLPCYCEDSDLCLRIQAAGYDVYCNPHVTVMHHLSKSTDALGESYKLKCVYKNVTTLKTKWQDHLQKVVSPKVIALYLPQFHPFSENNKWWGQGFTEWTNVSKAKPNFVGHYQPRYPADLGYYDLRLPEILAQQAALAKQYGVGGFCFYYYWFDGKRLLEQPIEHMLKSKEPDFPFCLCWANENWTRRWDGLENDVLIAQAHSPEDDIAVINDLIRYFKDARYIRIDGRPLLLVYRVALFPNFIETAARWRDTCRQAGIGEIYLTSVESFDGVNGNRDPATFGCDAAVEFPPHGMGEAKPVPGAVLNPNFAGTVGHYNDVAVRFATRPAPAYTRFRSVMPGWDNTARRQDTSFCFDQSTPGAFQAWLEESLEQTRLDRYGDEKLVFLNAWNEWAEGTYLEPDKRFGHTYLEAVRNALDAKQLKR